MCNYTGWGLERIWRRKLLARLGYRRMWRGFFPPQTNDPALEGVPPGAGRALPHASRAYRRVFLAR